MRSLDLLPFSILAACAAPAPNPLAVERPNVLLIVVDDLGATDAGCCGSEYYETPNIDRLAAGGVRFTNAYAAAAVCSPTRAALLTGRAPARLGLTDWIRARFQGGVRPPDGRNPSGFVRPAGCSLEVPQNPLWLEHSEVTVAEMLAPAGYASGHVGKWHLGLCAWFPAHQGFAFNRGGCDYGQPPSYFDPYFRDGQGDIPTLPSRREGEYLTDREADEAVAFLRAHRDEPFFLHFAPYAVHTPLQAKEELVARYRAKPATNHANPDYAAMVHSVDDAVGRVLSTLDELDLAERTLVIFTSDNGGFAGVTDNVPWRAGKGYPYEGGIRVPWIVRWPGVVPAGRVSDAPVISMDLLPTIAEACSVETPRGVALDGQSLLAHLRSRGEEPLRRDSLFWHFPHYRDDVGGPFSILRAGSFKLIQWWEGPRLELYDLGADPGETRDLAASRPELVADLRARLAAELARVGARLPRPVAE
ncbi:MAG: sulfatase [Planctomycetota bacterium]